MLGLVAMDKRASCSPYVPYALRLNLFVFYRNPARGAFAEISDILNKRT